MNAFTFLAHLVKIYVGRYAADALVAKWGIRVAVYYITAAGVGGLF